MSLGATYAQVVTWSGENGSTAPSDPNLVRTVTIVGSINGTQTSGYILLWKTKASAIKFQVAQKFPQAKIAEHDINTAMTDACLTVSGRSLDEAKCSLIINYSMNDGSKDNIEKMMKKDMLVFYGKVYGRLPGLIVKVFVHNPETNSFGGIYLFTGEEERDAYINSKNRLKPIACLGACLQVDIIKMMHNAADKKINVFDSYAVM